MSMLAHVARTSEAPHVRKSPALGDVTGALVHATGVCGSQLHAVDRSWAVPTPPVPVAAVVACLEGRLPIERLIGQCAWLTEEQPDPFDLRVGAGPRTLLDAEGGSR